MTKHVLSSNGMGYFWCSCNPSQPHVLWSLNEHIAQIANDAHRDGYGTALSKPEVDKVRAAARAEGARDMRTKIETLAEKYAPTGPSHSYSFGECPCVKCEAHRDLRALLADGGEPQ